MKLEEIKELMKAMEEYDLRSFSYHENGVELSLSRGESFGTGSSGTAAAESVKECAEAVPASEKTERREAEGAEKKPAPAQPSVLTGTEKVVKSPLVGTFYAAAAPDQEPFVKPGDSVKKGQVLGIIEAMKLMNEIESEYDGVVESVLVNNEEVVEYGQPLFRIR